MRRSSELSRLAAWSRGEVWWPDSRCRPALESFAMRRDPRQEQPGGRVAANGAATPSWEGATERRAEPVRQRRL